MMPKLPNMSEYEKMTIKMWAVEDRPREKTLKHGLSALSDAELIAILIGSGNAKETAVELSRRILAAFDNNLMAVRQASVDKLKEFNGIGEAKAINILAALELGKRHQLLSPEMKPRVQSSIDAFNIVGPMLTDLPHEEFWAIYLNRANQLIDSKCVSRGGVSGTVMDVRLIMKLGVEKLASSIILAHNHPSGNPEPSKADIDITRKCRDAGKILDIQVVDHIIVAGKNFTSLADEGHF